MAALGNSLSVFLTQVLGLVGERNGKIGIFSLGLPYGSKPTLPRKPATSNSVMSRINRNLAKLNSAKTTAKFRKVQPYTEEVYLPLNRK